MAQMKITAAALSAVIALTTSAPAMADGRNPTVYSVNQPVVQRVDYAIDLGAGGNGIADSELYRLSEWFESLQLGYGDRVFVDAGYGGERARQDVARVADEYGLLVSPGTPVTSGGGQPGSVRVIVSRSEASVPGCPDWADGSEINARISTSSNYGCAINSNLARMIADPNDLVLGQTHSGNGNAATASKAIRFHRDSAPTGTQGLKDTITKGGK